MTCSRCPRPAQIRVDERIVLCAECWNEIFERLKADFNSVPELTPSCGVRASAEAEINVMGDSSPMHDGRTWEQRRALTNGDSLVLEPTLTGRGPCDSGALISIASVRDTADASATVATELSPGPGVATVAHSFDDGIPEFLRRQAP